MRTATRIVAASFGIAAGIAGLEHGYFEMLQGNVRPASLMFASMGPPCEPAKVWNACEPAMTVLPNLLLAGSLTVFVGLLILIGAAAFVQRKNGGRVLMLLSGALLLSGGGIFPPLIGLIGGVAGTKINTPLIKQPGQRTGGIWRFLAKLWPWPLAIFLVWILGQFVIGYFFNEFLQKNAYLSLLLILGLLPLSVFTGYAHDILAQTGYEERKRM
jgi:hypothetical protein